MNRFRTPDPARPPSGLLKKTTQVTLVVATVAFMLWFSLGPWPTLRDPMLVVPFISAAYVWSVGGCVMLVGLVQVLVISRTSVRPCWSWQCIRAQIPRVLCLSVVTGVFAVTVDSLVFARLTAVQEFTPGQWAEIWSRLGHVDLVSMLSCTGTAVLLWGLLASTGGLVLRLRMGLTGGAE